jgi:hypothetical protein
MNNIKLFIKKVSINFRPQFVQEGLKSNSNKYDGTDTDKAITTSSPFGSPTHGIASHQGWMAVYPIITQPEDMAGNLFQDDGTVNDDYDDINNQGTSFSYHYPSNFNLDYPNVVLKDFTQLTVTENPVLITSVTEWTYENGCPSNEESSSGIGSDGLRGSIEESETNISTTEATLAVLVDGGDTEMLNNEVETSLPPETIQVYDELMGNSPYLSETVVTSAIEKEDVLPDAMIRDIMVANPHTAKSDELMNKLDDRWNPLPEYMKAQILQGKSIVSIKEELESQLAGYHQKRALTFKKLVKWFQKDSINPEIALDSLVLLYQNDNVLNSKYRLVMLHLERGDNQAASMALNNIPGQFSLVDNDLIDHEQFVSFFNLFTDLLNEGKSLTQANESQINQLLQLESIQQGKASVYARNVLAMQDEITYAEPIILPDMAKSAKANAEYLELLNTEAPKQIEISPNPSNDYVIISYELELKKPGYTIEILDFHSNRMKVIDLENQKDQFLINVHNWKPGIYFISLTFNGNPIESTKFTVI